MKKFKIFYIAAVALLFAACSARQPHRHKCAQ